VNRTKSSLTKPTPRVRTPNQPKTHTPTLRICIWVYPCFLLIVLFIVLLVSWLFCSCSLDICKPLYPLALIGPVHALFPCNLALIVWLVFRPVCTLAMLLPFQLCLASTETIKSLVSCKLFCSSYIENRLALLRYDLRYNLNPAFHTSYFLLPKPFT